MINQIFSSVIQGATAVNNWFMQIMTNTGAMGYVMIILSIMVVIRFIINPMLKSGVGRSDSVKRKKDDE